jgi:DUF1680 family protein
MSKLSRREVLKAAAAAAVVGTGASVAPARLLARAAVGDAKRVSQHGLWLGNPRVKCEPFAYGEVRLLEGPCQAQFEANHKFFLAMDDDALLKPFRVKAGVAAPGADLGGWYTWNPHFDPQTDFRGYIPGHSFGQYLSGLSRAYAQTGDAATREKISALVKGFGAAVSGNFYEGYPLPAYTFDKSQCGLIDAAAFAGDPDALEVLRHATDAALPHLPEKALTRAEMEARPHPNAAFTWDESYTLPENFYLAWQRGAGDRYHSLAQRYLQDAEYFAPLAAGENVLPGQHAYSHLNALNSAMQAYVTDGSEMHFRAARNGFDFIAAQSFATGGWGPNETFVKPGSGGLGDSCEKTHSSFETPCGAYGHFKLMRYLIATTGDARYGDSMERVLYNTILGALPMEEGGRTFYYSDYAARGARKFYADDLWPCCSGTFPQVTADYGISAYFHTPRGVMVNLYVPSRATWHVAGARVELTQTTQYPYSREATMALAMDKPAKFAVALRVPAWAGPATRVSVNGKRVDGVELRPGTYASVQREWRNGDRIEMEFDMPMTLAPVDAEHKDRVALTRGPLTLFAKMDDGDSSAAYLSERDVRKGIEAQDAAIAAKHLIGGVRTDMLRNEFLAAKQMSEGSKDWTAVAGGFNLRLTSFENLTHENYRLYFDVKPEA